MTVICRFFGNFLLLVFFGILVFASILVMLLAIPALAISGIKRGPKAPC